MPGQGDSGKTLLTLASPERLIHGNAAFQGEKNEICWSAGLVN